VLQCWSTKLSNHMFCLLSEIKGQKDLEPFIGRSSLALSVNCVKKSYISSLHNKKLRNLALCPVNDQHFVTR
jgi:hypothetical protein